MGLYGLGFRVYKVSSISCFSVADGQKTCIVVRTLSCRNGDLLQGLRASMLMTWHVVISCNKS